MLRVIHDVSLRAAFGQVTVLLGTNGAGKTTTLACAQGLTARQGGDITLLGADPQDAGPELKARVGVMLQDGGLPPSWRPIPLLRHLARLYRDPAPVDDLVERLGIDEFDRTSIRRLSGGQKQRVALAAALVGRPEVVFLDEPSAGLDPQSRTVVFDLIDQLRRDGIGILLTTHLLDDAQRLADYVYIIDAGRSVAEGTVPQLLQDHAARTTGAGRLVFEAPSGLAGTFPTRDGVTLAEVSPGSYVLDGTLSPSDLAALGAWFAARDVMPASLTLSTPTLEDVFLDLATRTAAGVDR
ncbi:ABC transporter ATP-binding protein [Tersicoccus sp. MR15.9]|uniref:ABC transporter ATP-binding protein n=1 Tax=Tersicoccus mangrovi TaxID=3121635 RepID=UPI002FE5F18C